MLKKVLGFLILVLAMTAALVAYSSTNNVEVPDVSGAATSYKQKIFAEVKEVAAPVLKEAGVDVEKVNTDDLNVVEKQMENATDKVNEATQALTQ
ncbi:MAG: hypothetical protein II902_06755 [Selenomonadaceae bacterium]|nr:hypothetical protein [Selenomonadaceae bacterium]